MKILKSYRTFIHTHGKNDITAAIIMIIFSVGLLGGLNYLFRDLSQEYQTYVELSAGLEKQIEEIKLHQAMAEVVTSGWYFTPENLDKEVSLISILSLTRDTHEIPDDLAISANSWCQEAYVAGSSDLARIETFQFTIEPLKEYKSRHLELYNANLTRTRLLCDLVADWSSLSQEDRTKALNEIIVADNQVQIVFAAFEAKGDQAEWQIEQMKAENDRIQTKINLVFWLMIIKSLASIFGIGIGLITIILFFDKDKPKQQNKRRNNKRRKHR